MRWGGVAGAPSDRAGPSGWEGSCRQAAEERGQAGGMGKGGVPSAWYSAKERQGERRRARGAVPAPNGLCSEKENPSSAVKVQKRGKGKKERGTCPSCPVIFRRS